MSEKIETLKTKTKSFFKKLGWIFMLLLILGSTGYYFYRTYVFSEGTRTGTIVKMSRKGSIFKTYEGQLHLDNSAIMNKASVFDFSVKDDATYDQLSKIEGQKAKVYYKELVNAFPWQGDTNYFIYKVEIVD